MLFKKFQLKAQFSRRFYDLSNNVTRRINHAAGANDGVEFLHGVKVQRFIQMLFRQTAAGGAANLNGLEGGAVFQAAADVKDNLPQGGSPWALQSGRCFRWHR